MSRYDIAVIGAGCVFPGASNLEQYWANICDGRSYFARMPERLWRIDDYYSPDGSRTDKSYTDVGAFIDDFEFPFLEYKLPPNSLKGVDPVQLVSMEVTKQALQDAGIAPRAEQLADGITIIGTSGVDVFAHATVYYQRHVFLDRMRPYLESRGVTPAQLDSLSEELAAELRGRGHVFNPTTMAIGAAPSSISNRIAQVFGVGGFNMTVDGACSSSLIAIDVACQALMAGDAKVALAGGADMGTNPAVYIGFSRVEGLSRSGRSCPFDHTADGLVIGEGVGIVVLKRLEDALTDGDRVRAVIRGIGSHSDGAGQAIYAPSLAGRIKVLEKALARAHTAPEEVQYVEAHATSTVVGDANEYDALSLVYGQDRDPSMPLHLGSVKYQIGHLKAAAGAAGLIKVLLAMEHGTIPHLPRFTKLTPTVRHPNPALCIPTEKLVWEPDANGKRVAAVTASGFGGVNYHLILEQSDAYTWPGVRCETPRELAVVGISLRIAGADSTGAFWDNVTAGKDVFSQVDARELGWGHHLFTGPEHERINSRAIGKIAGFEFDPLRYKIFPTALSQISQTQLLALDLTDRLLRDYGLDLAEPKNIGVSVGSMHDDNFPTVFAPMILDEYASALQCCPTADLVGRDLVGDCAALAAQVIRDSSPPITEHTLPGWLTNITSGRLSNKVNLNGPTFVVDSACSSGIAALLPATYQLMFGEVDMMISGGINQQLSDVFTAAVAQLGVVAESACRPFDVDGQGFLVGEGGVLYLLKRLADARRDGDEIFAVVHAVSGSSEADSKSMLAPTERAVRRAIRNTVRKTSIEPRQIGVVDTHGSANRVSDIVEAHSLASELRGEGSGEAVQITAIKSHVGHLYGGAGATSLLSTILSLRTGLVPGIRNLRRLRPEIEAIERLVQPAKRTRPLPSVTSAGGVNSMGLGGANFFAVVSVPENEAAAASGGLASAEFWDYVKSREPSVFAVLREVHDRYATRGRAPVAAGRVGDPRK